MPDPSTTEFALRIRSSTKPFWLPRKGRYPNHAALCEGGGFGYRRMERLPAVPGLDSDRSKDHDRGSVGVIVPSRSSMAATAAISFVFGLSPGRE